MNAKILASVIIAGLCASCRSDQLAGAAAPAAAPASPAAQVPASAAPAAPAAAKPAPAAAKPAPAAAKPAPAAAKPAPAEDFPADVRDLLRDLVENDALAALRESAITPTEAVVIRPFLDDRNGYVRDLLKTAVTDSGRTCVEAADDMWEDIMREIGWNQGFADILDTRTMTQLGRLLPTRVLIYGKLRVEHSAKGRPKAELSLHACDLETRRHIWGKTLRRPVAAPTQQQSTDGKAFKAYIREADCGAADISVSIVAKAADKASEMLADELRSIARENIGGRGFQIADDPKGADVSVTLEAFQSAFDRINEAVVMDGAVRVIATVPARHDYFLAETRIDRVRGERKLGDRDATLSVRDAISPRLVSWLGENVTAEKTGIEASRLVYDVSRLSENDTSKFISEFCRSLGSMSGVCACRLLEQSDDEAAFYVSFLPKAIPEGVINAGRVRFPALFATVDNVR